MSDQLMAPTQNLATYELLLGNKTLGHSIRWGAVSITGNHRKNNEDRFLAHPGGRYFLVADGMGGSNAGEKASEMAVQFIPQYLNQLIDFNTFSPEQVIPAIEQAISYANVRIMLKSQLVPECHNLGTTIALVLAAGPMLYTAGVGDSRVYLKRAGRLAQLTKDHSMAQALVDAGTITEAEAATHRFRNVLFRYLGSKEGGTGADPLPLQPEPGDQFVLCSDGVTDGIDDEELFSLLNHGNSPIQTAQAIVDAAQAGGSKDNITCIVLQVNKQS